MAEDLADYLLETGLKVRYLHSNIDTIERIEIVRDLRLGEFDVLVGINLLREGLDLPEVQLVAILDADKTGFLRSASALIQTMGRAARNVDGKVVLYADTISDAMRDAISETQRRRVIQQAYNAEHGIDPTTIRKAVTDILARLRPATATGAAADSYSARRPGRGRGGPGGTGRGRALRPDGRPMSAVGGGRSATQARGAGRGRPDHGADDSLVIADFDAPPADIASLVRRLDSEMKKAASDMRYEEAALLRDEIAELRVALAEEPVGSALESPAV